MYFMLIYTYHKACGLETRKHMKRVLTFALALFMVCGAALATESEPTRLGNDIAGYLTTDVQFFPFTSINIPAEDAQKMKEDTGYCQYICLEGPASGTILTMNSYTAEYLGEGTLTDHLNLLATLNYQYFGPLFENPTYDIQTVATDDMHGFLLMLIFDQNTLENPDVFLIAIPYHSDGYYGELIFENFEYNEDAMLFLASVIKTYEHRMR